VYTTGFLYNGERSLTRMVAVLMGVFEIVLLCQILWAAVIVIPRCALAPERRGLYVRVHTSAARQHR
jgi:hypothetical protein